MLHQLQSRSIVVFPFTALLYSASAASLVLESAIYGFSSFDFLPQIPRPGSSALSKRDVCTDAIPGRVTQICTPGDTLCCVPSNVNIAFPQCQQLFGQGFCCVEEDGACYTDMQSDCSAAGAVRCSVLAEGTTEACCPQFTECPSNFNQTTPLVRCQFTPLAGGSTSSTSSSSTLRSSTRSISASASATPSSSSTSLSVSASIFTTASTSTPASSNSAQPSATQISSVLSSSESETTNTSPSVPDSKGLSAGANAGIGIAAAVAVLAFAAVGFCMYKRGKKRGELVARGMSADRFPPLSYHDATDTTGQPLSTGNQGFHRDVNYGKHELPSERQFNELATERDFELSELSAGDRHSYG